MKEMKPLNIRCAMRDEERGITFTVVAYRRLTPVEAEQAFRAFLWSPQGRSVKRGHRYEVVTSIGLNERRSRITGPSWGVVGKVRSRFRTFCASMRNVST